MAKTKLAQSLEQCSAVGKAVEEYEAAILHMISCYNNDPIEMLKFYNNANYIDTHINIGDLNLHIETVSNLKKNGDKFVDRKYTSVSFTSGEGNFSIRGKIKDLVGLFNHENLEIINRDLCLKLLELAEHIHYARNIDSDAVQKFYLNEHKIK